MSTDVNDFQTLTDLEKIRKGVSGEKFILESLKGDCVVKFEKNTPSKSLIGTKILERAGVTSTPGMKKIDQNARQKLAQAAAAYKPSGANSDCDEFIKYCKDLGHAAVIMDRVQGKDVAEVLEEPEKLVEALNNPEFAQMLGRIVAADAFALNSDRIIVLGETEKSVAFNQGNLMVRQGTAVPIDPGFMYPANAFRPGTGACNTAAPYGFFAWEEHYAAAPSVCTFSKLHQSALPDEAAAIFDYFVHHLPETLQGAVTASRGAFTEHFTTAGREAAAGLLKRRQGWKEYILECGGLQEDVEDFRTHKRFLNQIARGESVDDAGRRAKDVMEYRRWVMTIELKMTEADARKILNENDWDAYKRKKEATPLDGKSDCFLSTATFVALGRGDECRELNQLRWFRDRVLRNLPGGPEAIADYYRIAPAIVTRIESQPNSGAIFRDVYDNGIGPALAAIRAGWHAEAYRIYRALVLRLDNQHPC